MHNHTSCDHVLKFCSKCEVPYCILCKKQWYENGFTYVPTPPYSPYYSILPHPISTITYTTNGTNAICQSH